MISESAHLILATDWLITNITGLIQDINISAPQCWLLIGQSTGLIHDIMLSHPCNAAITPLHFQAHKFNKLIEIDYIFKKKIRKHGQVVYKKVKTWEFSYHPCVSALGPHVSAQSHLRWLTGWYIRALGWYTGWYENTYVLTYTYILPGHDNCIICTLWYKRRTGQ